MIDKVIEHFVGEVAAFMTEPLRKNARFKELIDRGNRSFKLLSYQDALRCYTEAIHIKPDNPSPYFLRAEVLRKQKRYEEAISTFDEALRIKPDYDRGWSLRGDAFLELGQYQEALQSYTKALQLKPHDLEIKQKIKNCELVLNGSKHDTDATEVVHDWQIETPLTAEEFFNRGLEKYNLGDYQGAIADYTQAIQLQPDDAYAYYNRGIAKYNLEDYQGAIADFTQAIQLQPNDADTYFYRGAAKDDLGDYQGAIADYTQAIQLQPNYAIFYNNRGIAKSNLGNYQEELADYNQAAQLYQQQGDMELYRKAIENIKNLENESKEFWRRLFS